ncbi:MULTISPECIES: transposase [Halomonas]|uniref:Transposase DDE domain group 1 n=1 Tax=Vreelandella aquamarina TaxID=77097 RepID=A0A1N6D2K7_9GAMM|nr:MULTISPECIES: transposase [Halomonas]MCG7605672.1 transposase [Halomonas sp. MM17-34]MCG7605675.1 transposase [Halomonas sp. MM17-34]SIN65015.1 Transposase DDE domain group 1 [Halomonas meridiana]SIN75845.1 Transposase DDE domain group 1 [Halomonas meridiana]SIO38029.1 Transposase DDE domain group 1 [Halomonas meridiana]
MPNIKFRASRRTLTSHAGLSIIGQCFEIAGVDSIDSRFPTTLGMRTSDVIKSYLGLLCLGMSDYDAVENFRRDKPFQQLLTLQKVPSAATLRQRLEKLAANDLQARTATWSTTLLSLIEAPITAETTHVCLDIDTFVMDNSNSKKEGVSRTYQKVDGYTPIAAYLGNEGWCLGLELRPGKQHTMKESNAFLERVLPRAQCLTKQPILLREDSGFDSQALWPQTVSIHDDNKTEYVVQRVMRLVERTADRDGQLLLEPDYELEGWWTSLDEAPEAVIKRYQAHATHEQFHSEIKTDLDLERLPSGKFATNDLILHLAQLAYNILRLMGQLGMTGELSPVRHPAKRRRIRTVLQELVHRAALVIHKARQIILDFGQDIGRMTVLKTLRSRLRYPRGTPC